MSHTPGPWEPCFHLQSKENDGSCPCGFRGDIWAADREHIVCTMGEPASLVGLIEPIERSTELSNARLIAAAPELLAVMKEAELDCRGYEALHGWVEKAVAAIAKAEGAQ